MVLEKDDKDTKAKSISKSIVSRRIDEMSEDIEMQLVEFSVQLDESTLRESEAVLITYVRYVDKDGAPIMMGKKNACLKLMKDENPNMFLVHS
ncbi:SCAN domain-containing protein 3 [Trichonephila clavata]|uniref:SCAN domain-containing protein 3 n=1 Tax=Trichonephila clavata TaxID=2740835 RepID=A0A8X6G5H5_TRICU|nr:SCAN domain-containing protein 3 [Trichonephila clavata]